MHQTKTLQEFPLKNLPCFVPYVSVDNDSNLKSAFGTFNGRKLILQYVYYRLPVWNKLEASCTWSSSTLSHVKTIVSAVWSSCVHKKNCKTLYGKCVMQFDMLKKLQICEIWIRDQTDTLLGTKSNDTFLRFQVFVFPVYVAQNITEN
jgi:hypothetical protein